MNINTNRILNPTLEELSDMCGGLHGQHWPVPAKYRDRFTRLNDTGDKWEGLTVYDHPVTADNCTTYLRIVFKK